MPSVEVIPGLLGLYRVIEDTHRKDTGFSQWHRWILFQVLWAHTGPSAGAPHRNEAGPSRWLWWKLFQVCWAHKGASGAHTGEILDTADGVGRSYSRFSGPIQVYWGHTPKRCWAQLMSSVEVILSLLGLYRCIGGTQKKRCQAQLMPSVKVIQSLLGPHRCIGGTHRKHPGPSRWCR